MPITIEEIVRRFDISLSAAQIRLTELQRIERARLGKLRPLPPGVEGFLRAQKANGFTVTSIDIED